MIKHDNYRSIFALVLILHLIGLMIPLGPKIVQKVKDEVIQIKLILPNKNLTVVSVPDDPEALDAIPDNARFLSDKNQKVLEETVAKPKQKKGELTLGDIAQDSLKDIDINSNIPKKDIGGQDISNQKSISDEYVVGDFLENVQESDKTSINTIQFKYFSFYKRIKEQVEGQWNSLLNKHLPEEMKLHKNLETIALIKIDKEGRIIGAKIEQDSGLPFLDKIVIITFDKIEYFHNPPKELFKDRDHLYIQWGFRVGL